MVLHKHGERLYAGLKEVVTQHLESKVDTEEMEMGHWSLGWSFFITPFLFFFFFPGAQ